MKTDSELRGDVERELEWEPRVDERKIGVAAVDGIVTLTGDVSSYDESWSAERAVERVEGVRGIANELEVMPAGARSDTEIAEAAANALRWNVEVPADKITVRVENGWLTLKGEVPWNYQRRAAERVVRGLHGMRGISNLITVQPRSTPEDVKHEIEATFKRQATFDANHVTVQVVGSEVILRGSVRSWMERHEAETAAMAAPGITAVQDYISVGA